jgi:hypothetical protein
MSYSKKAESTYQRQPPTSLKRSGPKRKPPFEKQMVEKAIESEANKTE